MAYPQPFGYACPTVPSSLPGSIPPSLPSSQLLMSASGSPQTPTTVPTSCCESGRPIMTDPNTGQTVCSCQYAGSAAGLLPYPRVAGLPDAVYSSAYAAQGYMPFGTDPSAFYSPLNSAYDLKDGSDAWRSLAHPTPCYPYDPTMGAGYPYGQSALAQRKNATREATSTLKAWLQEHIKNPYPTKGEKIMLAIITKMTLTQVSTWFANARRRLKKENKMTWSPRNRTDEDGNKIDSDDEDDKNDDDKDRDDSKTKDDDDELIDAEGRDSVPLNICVDDSVSDILSDGRTDSSDKKDESRFSSCGVRSGVLPPTQVLPSSPMSIINTSPPIGNCMSSQDSNSQKPRIWSLADVATSSSPPEAARGPPPINPKLGNPLDSSRYSPVSSFRPWVNGAHPHPYGASAPAMASSNPSGPTVAPSAANPQGLLRPYSLVARPEVH